MLGHGPLSPYYSNRPIIPRTRLVKLSTNLQQIENFDVWYTEILNVSYDHVGCGFLEFNFNGFKRE